MNEKYNLLLQNQLLHEEIKRRVDQISAINTVAATVGHSLDLSVTLDTALEAVLSVVGAEAGGISLIDERSGEVVLRAQRGWLNDFVMSNPMRIPLGRGMSGQVITNDDVVVHNNLDEQSEYAVPSFSKEAFRSIAMAPMHARGKIIGILSIMSHRPQQFDDEIVDMLRAIADTVGVAIDNARLYEDHVESENRLKAIFYSTADGIIATDRNSRVNLINHTAARMLDVQADAMIGVPLREASIQVRVRDKLLLALSPEAADAEQTFEVTLDNDRQLAVKVSPVRVMSQVEGGMHMDGWVIVLQDITHLREAEMARMRFIQAAAHDMKNPLSVTQSSLHMLASMADGADATISEVLDIAQTGIRRVQRLIDDMLQIEKIENGYGFNREDVDIREMIYEIIEQVKPLLQAKNISYDVSIADDLPHHLWIDRDWMQRALHNYLENAAKYSNKDSHIGFMVLCDPHQVHFEVLDAGPGIPQWAQPHLFERFYRVQERRDIRGSGLGLAIVKSVAEAHGGYAYVQSAEGAGSTFGIALPRSDVDPYTTSPHT